MSFKVKLAVLLSTRSFLVLFNSLVKSAYAVTASESVDQQFNDPRVVKQSSRYSKPSQLLLGAA